MPHDTTTHPARPTPAFVWGYNNRAGLGLGHTARVLQPTAARLPADTVDVQGGINFTVALTADGALYAWGGNQYGQLGDGSATIRREPTPVALPKHAKASAIAVGTDHVLALTRDRQVLAWGRNHRGQIGIGSTSDQHTPVVVLGHGIASIGAGNAISAAVTDQGELRVWGRNSFGQLGLAPVLARRYGTDGPHEVHEHQLRPASAVLPRGAQAALVDAGQRHLAVVTTDGKLVQFGIDAAGTPQAGELALKPSWGRPVQISAGDDFTLIRTNRGLLLAVGGNGDGQLGLGDRRPRNTPALVTLPHAHGTVADVWAGARSALAITSAHEVYTWGDTSLGQTGHGVPNRPGATAQPNPRKIDTLSGARITNASGGAHHMILTGA